MATFVTVCATVSVFLLGIHMIIATIDNTVENSIHETEVTDRDVVCSGSRSHSGLSKSGSDRYWYNDMLTTYTGCTYVDGNLIITHLLDGNISYDFSFLNTVRYVRGYVLVALSRPETALSFPNLEIIRGNSTFSYRGQDLALGILVTNFTSLHLPKLKEISNGDVSISASKIRDMEMSRDWDIVMKGRTNSRLGSMLLEGRPVTSGVEERCSSRCPRRCFREGDDGCCNRNCAGGCWGPWQTHCELCKDYSLLGICVSHCPYEPVPYYHHGRQCLRTDQEWNTIPVV